MPGDGKDVHIQMWKGAWKSSIKLELLRGGSRRWPQPESMERNRNKIKITWKESEFISNTQ